MTMKFKGISSDADSVIPMYCDAVSKNTHERNILKLFDLNFGKDWVFFLNFFYWERFGKHHIVFRNPHKLEKQRTYFIIRRKAYYKLAKNLMEFYFQHSFEEAEDAVLQDKFRLHWSETPQDKKTHKIWISSELFEQVKGQN